jgi:hypothetical protein
LGLDAKDPVKKGLDMFWLLRRLFEKVEKNFLNLAGRIEKSQKGKPLCKT